MSEIRFRGHIKSMWTVQHVDMRVAAQVNTNFLFTRVHIET